MKGTTTSIRRYRILLAVFVLLCLAFLGFVAWTHSTMPAEVAVHFDARGKPDRIANKMELTAVMAGTGFSMLLLFGLGSILFPKIPPKYLNLPNRDYWLQPERSEKTFADYNVYYLAMGIATMILMFQTHWATWQVAMGTRDSLPFGFWDLGIYLAVITLLCVLLYRRFGRLPKQADDISRDLRDSPSSRD